MRPLIGAFLLIGTVMLSGCGGDENPTVSATKLELTPEQAEAIRKQDEMIQNEEGGPDKIIKPKKKAR